jgi:hypothetical protein
MPATLTRLRLSTYQNILTDLKKFSVGFRKFFEKRLIILVFEDIAKLIDVSCL